jgi:acetyl esterase
VGTEAMPATPPAADRVAAHAPVAPPAPLGALQRAEAAGARAIAALPPRIKRLVAGRPVHRDGLELDLDTQLVVKLAERNKRSLAGQTPTQAREEIRSAVRVVEGPRIELPEVYETTVAGAAGPLRARVYVPEESLAQGAGALTVYYHGGGWVRGDLDTHDQPCRLLAKTSGTTILSVDYRLAPEDPFPAAVDDALAAFRDAVARSSELGVDPARIAVAGDSAGGHLAAVTAQQCAAEEGQAPAFQLLIYPATDSAEDAPSRATFAEGFILTKEEMDWYEERFLAPDDDRRDPRVSPLWASDLTGVAPALVVTAGFDPLRDEGEAYARRLSEAGVRCLLRRHSGFVHGFIHFLALGPGSRQALAEMGGVLRAALTP